MKDNKYQTEKELNLLLQKLFLQEINNAPIQKPLAMIADYVFEGTPEVLMQIEKEKKMLKKLKKTFVPSSGNIRPWKIFLTGLLVISIGIFLWRMYKVKTTINHFSGSKTNIQVNSGQEENKEPDKQKEKKSGIQSSIPETPEIMVEIKDTVAVENNKPEKKNNVNTIYTPAKSVYFFSNQMDEKDLYPAPAPSFNAKATPENFIPGKAFFKMDSLHKRNYSFFISPAGFTAGYYRGEPFKKGSLPDMQYINYGEYIQELQNYKWSLPASVLLHANPGELRIERPASVDKLRSIVLDKIPESGTDQAINPFYFRKFEVTNKEYREFVEWVRVSNGYGDKKFQEVSVDTVPVNDPNDKWGQQIVWKGKKYRIIHKTKQLKDFEKVFSYKFFQTGHTFLSRLKSATVFVLPDTTCWVSDFPFSFNQPMTNMYFWHPAYDNYPVVGVSWYQCMAYLDWKTRMHQQQLNEQNIPLEVEYILPSEIHWELISMTAKKDKKLVFKESPQSINWLTDLGLAHQSKNKEEDRNHRTAYLKNLFTKDQYKRGDFTTNGFFHTGPSDLAKQKLPEPKAENLLIGPLDISWLGGNVSEWMQESYRENWQPFFELHQKTFPEQNAELQLAAKIEAFFNESNDQDGRLVRGANWYDERFGQKAGSDINDAGMSPKRFIDPFAQHSTIGFRYVMRIKRKD